MTASLPSFQLVRSRLLFHVVPGLPSPLVILANPIDLWILDYPAHRDMRVKYHTIKTTELARYSSYRISFLSSFSAFSSKTFWTLHRTETAFVRNHPQLL